MKGSPAVSGLRGPRFCQPARGIRVYGGIRPGELVFSETT